METGDKKKVTKALGNTVLLSYSPTMKAQLAALKASEVWMISQAEKASEERRLRALREKCNLDIEEMAVEIHLANQATQAQEDENAARKARLAALLNPTPAAPAKAPKAPKKAAVTVLPAGPTPKEEAKTTRTMRRVKKADAVIH